jgi:hypothetical protein
VTQINKSEGYCGTTGVPLPERKEAA